MISRVILANLVWDAAQYWPVAVMFGAACSLAVFWLYRPAASLAIGRLRWVLPMLRTLALLALALSIVKPVLVLAGAAG